MRPLTPVFCDLLKELASRNIFCLMDRRIQNNSLELISVRSVQSLNRFGRQGDMRDDSAEILFQPFQQETLVSNLAWAGMSSVRCCPSSISSDDHGIAHPLRCPEGGFGEAVVACDMSEQCKFPSLDSRQKRFLWTGKEVDLALHRVGRVLCSR